jgi:hypothetical protein
VEANHTLKPIGYTSEDVGRREYPDDEADEHWLECARCGEDRGPSDGGPVNGRFGDDSNRELECSYRESDTSRHDESDGTEYVP